MKLHFFSIQQITQGIESVIRRFPLSMLSALSVTILSIASLHADDSSFYANIILTLTLAFPLFTGLVLLGEQKGWEFKHKILSHTAAVVFLLLYYLWLPENIFSSQNILFIRHILWTIGFILFISFAPFLQKGENIILAFWHYNKKLFFSFILTYLWAMAIQLGTSVALMSIDFLFEISIDTKRYMELWIVNAGVFSTTFFLSRIPKDFTSLQKNDYPKELRFFTQYVLMPFVTIYFLILYAYVVRILVIWQWPKGTLAYMILGFSFLGVLTYVFLYPLRESSSYIRWAGNIFSLALIPQVGMLFWALYFRISQYGFTENRYFVFIFGWWLLVLAIYLLASKKKDIRWIPITLFCIALFSSFGPWSAFAISEKSQIHRLENLLIKNQLLINGKIQKSQSVISYDDRKEISAAIRYLNDVHGLQTIQGWFTQDLKTLEDNKVDGFGQRYYRSNTISKKIANELIGIEYVEQWEVNVQDESFSVYTDNSKTANKIIDISRYDFLHTTTYTSGDIAKINGAQYRFTIDNGKGQFVVLKDDAIIAQADFQAFLKKILQERSSYPPAMDQDELKLEFENENIALVIYFNSIYGQRKNDQYSISSISAQILFALKSP